MQLDQNMLLGSRNTMKKVSWHTWPRVIGSNLLVGGPGRLPPNVWDENALLYISFHLPCSLSRSDVKSTGPPASSSSLAAASALRRSSSFAARPLFTPETALCNPSKTLHLKKVRGLVNFNTTLSSTKLKIDVWLQRTEVNDMNWLSFRTSVKQYNN